MKLYNSLTKKVEDLKPLKDQTIGFYSCGPTVYDHAHLGNFRTYIIEDLLRRTIRASGYEVKHVMNITDVDDKTIKRSREQYPDKPTKDALHALTRHYETVFLEDAEKLGIDFSGSRLVRATDHINDMQQLVARIPNKYVRDDGVYFDIGDYDNYGVLTQLDRQHVHHRIKNDEYDKERVADFALWKTEGAPNWPFEIEGRLLPGRPGWHIECSAMSVKYLGQPFDIHSGGVDLKFPHHENEIAQTRAATGKQLANIFVHIEHLLVDGHKMSKSLNNFYTLQDILDKSYEPLAFRLLVLQAHYRSQLNFTWESLRAAAENLKSLRAWADLRFQKADKLSGEATNNLLGVLLDSLQADLNSAKSLALLNEYMPYGSPSMELLQKIDQLLGLQLAEGRDIEPEQQRLIEQREAARRDKNWQRADEIRAALTEQGLEINDTEQGPIWSRI